MEIIGLIGMFAALALLIVLALRGWNVLLIALISTAVVALTNGRELYSTFMEDYMTGYVTFFKSNFLLFLAGALFGKIMDVTGAADSIARMIVAKLGADKAVFAVVVSCFILAYGGVSAFVLVFTIYPIAVNLFKESNLPRSYLPGTIAFGTVTFAMTSPGTPQIQNIIPGKALGTSPMSGAVVGIVAGIFMFIIGMIWLTKNIKAAQARGETFISRPDEEAMTQRDTSELPNPVIALIPLIATIILLNVIRLPVEVSVGLGIFIGIILFKAQLNYHELPTLFTAGSAGAVSAIANTCAVVGFGNVIKVVPAFQQLIDVVTNIPGPPLLGAAIAVTVMAGVCGSASGGIGIAMPIIGPIYTALGVSAEHLHRVAAIASGALDSLPHNGYIVTLLNYCGVSHKEGYMPIFWLTVILPAFATGLAILLFSIFPTLP